MEIGTRKIDEAIIRRIIQDTKKKKELGQISDRFVEDVLKRYLSVHAKVITQLQKGIKSSAYKQIIKDIRNELRRVHSLYLAEQQVEKRWELFDRLTKTKQDSKEYLELHKQILKTHSSTRERLDAYPKIYERIFKITGKPKTILDLGSGLNPFSIPFMELPDLNYYAFDINHDEINLLNKYFEYLNEHHPETKGKAEVLDLLKFSKLQEADLCLLWKMTDMLDRFKGHKVSEEVIKAVPCRYVVVSFPTKTITGKQMNHPRRKWIELMCERLGYSFKVFKISNEIFYLIIK